MQSLAFPACFSPSFFNFLLILIGCQSLRTVKRRSGDPEVWLFFLFFWGARVGSKGARQQFSWTRRDTFDLFCWILTVSVSPDFPLGLFCCYDWRRSRECGGAWTEKLPGGDVGRPGWATWLPPWAPGLLSCPGVEEQQRKGVIRSLLKPLCSLL